MRFEHAGGVRVTRESAFGDAHGLSFLCPKCFALKGGGAHRCIITFSGRGAPGTIGPFDLFDRPVRWEVAGSGVEDLVVTPSIELLEGCRWHGHIGGSDGLRAGEVT